MLSRAAHGHIFSVLGELIRLKESSLRCLNKTIVLESHFIMA